MQREVDGVGELGVEQAAPAGGLADLPVVHGHAVEGAHSSIWNSHQPYCTLPRCLWWPATVYLASQLLEVKWQLSCCHDSLVSARPEAQRCQSISVEHSIGCLGHHIAVCAFAMSMGHYSCNLLVLFIRQSSHFGRLLNQVR